MSARLIMGRKVGSGPLYCAECDEEMEQTSRLAWYCPLCDVCPECYAPLPDGMHWPDCTTAMQEGVAGD